MSVGELETRWMDKLPDKMLPKPPCRMASSLWQTPQAIVFTRMWPFSGCLTGTSLRTRSPPISSVTIALHVDGIGVAMLHGSV